MKTTPTLPVLALLVSSVLPAQGEETLFNDGWMFSLQDTPEARESGFNDSGWTPVSLPHD